MKTPQEIYDLVQSGCNTDAMNAISELYEIAARCTEVNLDDVISLIVYDYGNAVRSTCSWDAPKQADTDAESALGDIRRLLARAGLQ